MYPLSNESGLINVRAFYYYPFIFVTFVYLLPSFPLSSAPYILFVISSIIIVIRLYCYTDAFSYPCHRFPAPLSVLSRSAVSLFFNYYPYTDTLSITHSTIPSRVVPFLLSFSLFETFIRSLSLFLLAKTAYRANAILYNV